MATLEGTNGKVVKNFPVNTTAAQITGFFPGFAGGITKKIDDTGVFPDLSGNYQLQNGEIYTVVVPGSDTSSNKAILRKLDYIGKEVQSSKRRQLDPWTATNRTPEESDEFKQRLVEYYQRQDPVTGGNLFCMVLNRSYPRAQVKAAHIWKWVLRGKGLDAFGLTFDDASDVRNGMLLAKDLEEAFDLKRVCFRTDMNHDLILQVLDPSLNNKVVFPSTQKTFANINGNKLQVPVGKLPPFRRLLNWHAKLSYEEALARKWILKADFDLFVDFGDISDAASNPDTQFNDEFRDEFEEVDEE